MKLWSKISLICACVLIIVVAICSALLSMNAKNRILAIELESAMAQESAVSESFRQMAEYYARDDLDAISERALAQYCFRQFAPPMSALLQGGDTVYSNMQLNPAEYFTPAWDGEAGHFLGLADGKHILITAGEVTLFSQTYTVYLVRDVTGVYRNIAQLIWRFVIISGVCVCIGSLLIILLVRYAVRPLRTLRESAKRIAEGDYRHRVEIAAKDEIGDLAQDFNAMAVSVADNYRQLQDTAEHQRFFMAGLTHEFKTPLTSVIGYADTLLCTDMTPERTTDALLHIRERCLWLESVTQKLLKIIALEETVERKPESVARLIDAARENTAGLMQSRGVVLKTSCSVKTLPMDFDLMLSLLINLLDNASKASKPGQTIWLKAHGCVIEVADQGVGIAQEEIGRITEPFYRTDPSRSREIGGSGLGLALVKKIADLHGARLQIDSAPGEGTRVQVEFNITN